MAIQRPGNILAGFSVDSIEDVPEFVHAGEQWVPRNFDISSHFHDTWELYFQASGESTWHSGGTTLSVPQNSLYIAPPGVVHSLGKNVPSKHHFLYVALDVDTISRRVFGMQTNWPNDRFSLVHDAASALNPFRLVVREVSLDLPFRAAGVRAALDALVIETSRLIFRTEDGGRISNSFEHHCVTYAKHLLERHSSRNWKVSDLARVVGVSPSHLADLFARDAGTTPRQYLLEQRLVAADTYLRSSELSITEIALEVGFSSSQYFATAYRRSRGRSPGAFRKLAASTGT